MSQPQSTAKAVKLPRLFNRELSWMAFNDRVLEEAQDETYPLLERLKFVAIVSSNLDEFFMIRVAGLERKAKRNPQAKQDDGSKIDDTLSQIREWAIAQKVKQGAVLREILDKVKAEGLFLQTHLDPSDAALVQFTKTVMPEPKIQNLTSIDQVKHLAGGQIYVFVRLKDHFAVLTWPDGFDRLVELPSELAKAKRHFVLAEKLLAAAAGLYFNNETVLEAFPFKLIRDADVVIDPDTDPEELLTTVEEAIQTRAKMPVVRLEVDASSISDGALLIANTFKLNARSVYRYDLPLDLKILWRVHALEGYEKFRFPQQGSESASAPVWLPNLVKVLQGNDLLLHHPYDSFDTVVLLLQAAAQDKEVVAIRQTLYRTSRSSAVVDALIEAAKRGKSVTVLVELRARFDEAQNITMAKELKKYGVKVLKGFPDKKIHCKVSQVIRREGDDVTSFVHIGTGNYNPSTARLYTDLSLLTASKNFGRDTENIFQSLQSGRIPKNFESFVVAPRRLHKKILEWIRTETKRAQKGDRNARIIVKVNALVDVNLVDALYKASRAGVKIDLIVRGICVLRPGVPGLSENIRVISIVDKFLEHSRIYYFQNGDNPLVYLSSADWMPRNFYNRIEVAFPIDDPDLKKYVREVVLETFIKDNQKARMLMPDGQWISVKPQPDETPLRAQVAFEKLAKVHYKGTPLYSRFIRQKEEQFDIPKASEEAQLQLAKSPESR